MFTGRRNTLRRDPAVIAAEKAAKDRHAMTCQCCGRRIFAQTGTIAHHGYQRPGFGQQTASCWGAKQLPYEADRTILGRMIEAFKRERNEVAGRIHNISIEAFPVPFTWEGERLPGYNPNRIRKTESVSLTRSNFAAEREKVPLQNRYRLTDFESVKASHLYRLNRQLLDVQAELDAQQARFDAWKITHQFEAGEWVIVKEKVA